MKRGVLPFVMFTLGAFASWGQSITVTVPNGGESWPLGAPRTITWQAAGISGNVRIVLDRNGAKLGDIAVNIPAAQQGYAWTVGALAGGGNAPGGGGYRVRVRAMGAETSDSSDADFHLQRDVGFSQQGQPDVQPGQSQSHDVRPNQNRPPDLSGVSGMPDLAIAEVEYKPAQHKIFLTIRNVGLAPYNGLVRCRLETSEGGCWGQEHRVNMPRDFFESPGMLIDFGPCDFFPSLCGHPFRFFIEPEGPDERSANNVLDTVLYRYPGYHFVPVPPVRLEFSHGSKQLECSRFVYDAANTISRNDVLNDYSGDTRTAQIRFVVGGRNCGNATSGGYLHLRLARDPGGNPEEVLTARFSYQHLAPGEEGRFEVTVDVPVRQGAYYAHVIGGPGEEGPGDICTAAFRFADEFFD